MIRGLALCCLLLLAAAPAGAEEPAARAERLAPAFDAIVFGAQPREILLRVEGPVVLQPEGPLSPANRAVLERHAADLTDLTGYRVRVGDGSDSRPEERPFWIYLALAKEMPPLLDRSWIPGWLQRRMPASPCAFVTRGDHRIKEAVIVINRGLAEETIAHCLIEETSQSLGAIDDTPTLDPSAFNDLGGLVDRLQPDDRVILRALFAPEVAPGQSRAAVLDRLPVLLREALAAEAP
ncbi:MAG: hypothetical protein Kilf2KO_24780 [Rhodospirillales bacterium]